MRRNDDIPRRSSRGRGGLVHGAWCVGHVGPTYGLVGFSYTTPMGSVMVVLGHLRDATCMPRYRRYFSPGQTVFLTLVCERRRSGLRDERAKKVVLDALRNLQLRHPFKHHGHVLLDDHLHLLLSPADAVSVPRLVGSLKQAVLAQLPAVDRFWQRRYYDHIIRDADDFTRHLDYIHFNPVKHGLVDHAAAWPWSSFAAWQARGVYAADWGASEPVHLRGMTE